MNPKMLLTDFAETLQNTPQAVNQLLKRKDLPYKKSNNRIYFYHSTSRVLLPFPYDPKIISWGIVKGGTGKTTNCLSCGIRANLYGARVLMIDQDQQGNLTKSLGIDAHDHPVLIDVINQEIPIKNAIITLYEGLDILPSRIENSLLNNSLMLKRLPLDRVFRDLLMPLKTDYDLILIDCPPALGSDVTAAYLASDMIICPVTPSEFSIEGLQITTDEIANIEKHFKVSIESKILINEYDTRNSLSKDIFSYLVSSKKYGGKLLNTFIRKCQEFENTLADKTSIFDSLTYSTAKEDIDLLTVELLKIGQPKNKGNESLNIVEGQEEAAIDI